jgi:hypothetical protein
MDYTIDFPIRYQRMTENISVVNSTDYYISDISKDTGKPNETMGQVAADTLKVYGIIFCAFFLVYILFRTKYSAAYNARGLNEVNILRSKFILY